MNEPQNDGGPAFARPSVEITDNERNYGQTGMSLRDYFAAHETLSDCLDAASNFWSVILGRPMTSWQENPSEYISDECEARAKLRLMRADAMLKARAAK